MPTDADGLRVDALTELLGLSAPKFIYTIPVYHNPLGATLPAERRTRLVELAVRHGFKIVADEVYQLLSYEAKTPPPMSAYDPELASVISVSAFTKILGPGLRLGWIEAAPELCEALSGSGLRFSSGGVNPFTAELVRTAIEMGLQESYLARLKATLGSRARALTAALRKGLPETVQFSDPRGGYFVWLRLPEAQDTKKLLASAHEQGVGFRAGHLFACDGGLDDCLRVGFSYYDEPTLEEGARRLCGVLAATRIRGRG